MSRRPSPAEQLPSPLPDISPAYLGVGYIIGPRLAALNFAGGVLAWGLLVPLLPSRFGPYVQASLPPRTNGFMGTAGEFDLFLDCAAYCRGRHAGGRIIHAVPHAQAACLGMARAVSDLKKSAAAHAGDQSHRA